MRSRECACKCCPWSWNKDILVRRVEVILPHLVKKERRDWVAICSLEQNVHKLVNSVGECFVLFCHCCRVLTELHFLRHHSSTQNFALGAILAFESVVFVLG